jgi:hypothetical protein
LQTFQPSREKGEVRPTVVCESRDIGAPTMPNMEPLTAFKTVKPIYVGVGLWTI